MSVRGLAQLRKPSRQGKLPYASSALFISPEDPLKNALCTEVRGGVTHSTSDRSEYCPNQANVIWLYIVKAKYEYLLIF
jgi:hypothetical protein